MARRRREISKRKIRKGEGILSLGAAAFKMAPWLMGAFKGAKKVASVASKVGRVGARAVKKFKDVTGITARRRTKKLKDDWKVGQEMINYADKVRAPPKLAPKEKKSDVMFTVKRKKPSTLGKIMGEKETSTKVPINSADLNPTQHGDDVFYDSIEGSGIKRNIFVKDLRVKNHMKHAVPAHIGGRIISDKMYRPKCV